MFSKIKYATKEVVKDNNRVVCEYTIENPGKDIYFYPNEYDIDFIKIGNSIYSKDFEESELSNYEYLYPQINDCNQIGYNDGGIIKIHSKKKKITIVIAYTSPNYFDSNALYTFNSDVFIDYYNRVSKEKFEVTYFNDSIIEGNINLYEDKLVYTSIPYDIGWNVYIDGNKVDSLALSDSLLCFNASKGEHDIKLEYKVPQIELAALGNVVSIILLILLCINEKRKNKDNVS